MVLVRQLAGNLRLDDKDVSARILIVDHHLAFRYYLSLYLTLLDQGYEVIGEANTAAEALRHIEALAPDVVFTAIHLPDLSGLAFTRRVRQVWPLVAVIVISNHAAADYRQAALEAGAVDYVDKLEVVETLPAALLAIVTPTGPSESSLGRANDSVNRSHRPRGYHQR